MVVKDKTSFSTPEDVCLKHAEIFWKVDFLTKRVCGNVVWHVKVINEKTKLCLDTRNLKIHSIEDYAKKTALKYTLIPNKFEPFGAGLEIELPNGLSPNSEFRININYETTDGCGALQWLEPEQTAGKKHPYMFSQCQAIHARSLIPCQDSPGVKITYKAEVSVAAPLTCLMGAVRSEPECLGGGMTKTKFSQEIPISSYLIAIAVGMLESRRVGPRSLVWSEKEMVDAAAFEFAETEKMLETAESIMGPYVWKQYDMLILPPSFPYGGMENPCLTFVTPTILAGDRSLASVIAHEISHSWTGNLATNSTFDHFWLNEGHTTYLEFLICGKLAQSDSYRQFLAFNSWKDLREAVDLFGADHAYTRLVWDLENVDPDDSFSAVPYIKGFTLLYYLETKVGGRDVMEGFVKAMVEKFAYGSFTTEDWKACFLEHFAELTQKGVFADVAWDTWFYGLGLPPVKPNYDQTMANACAELCGKWCNVSETDCNAGKISADGLKQLMPMQVVEFLSQLWEKDSMPHWKIEKMQSLYQLDANMNSDIRFQWLRLCLKAKYEPAIPRVLDFVKSQGRMKYTRPLYRDLYAWEHSRPMACECFKENKKFMHPTTAMLVEKDLHLA